MLGKDKEQVQTELEEKGLPLNDIETLLPFRVFEGNHPSTSILYKSLSPKILGNLIALFEHKLFVQGVVWNIYSFDQWGVELGKELAKEILPQLQEEESYGSQDGSTEGLLAAYHDMIQPVGQNT